jgi:hypothetical protein
VVMVLSWAVAATSLGAHADSRWFGAHPVALVVALVVAAVK